ARADAELVQRVLREREGFAASDIVLLLDAQATRRAILAEVERQIALCQAGDLFLFYFAGHGSRLPDQDGDELDGWDETIVPYDAGTPPERANDIRDD